MDLNIPIYNELLKGPGLAEPIHRVAALFFRQAEGTDPSLRKATNRMLGRLQRTLNGAGRSWSHWGLAKLAFNPELKSMRLKLTLQLKHRTAKTSLLFVYFPRHGRWVGFAPRYDSLWFDFNHPSQLEQRATEVFTEHFRKLEREEDDRHTPESISNPRECWISWSTLTVRTDPPTQQEQEETLLKIFGNQQADGAEELAKVGQCLDNWYPEDLQRALFREPELERIQRLLQQRSRKAVLLVGPHAVGKTNLIHELVYRHVEADRAAATKSKSRFWWLSPQRLISGMMYVGQWEDRLLAILKETRKQNHVLYMDDLVGMFRAGQSRDSNLSVADLMKNALASHSVRLIGEITSEAYQVLASRDRGLADLFHVVRLDPTNLETTRRISIATIQQLELKQRCAFEFDVLPTAEGFLHAHGRLEASPGRIVHFLRELSVRHRGETIDAQRALQHFQSSAGLSKWLVSGGESIDPSKILGELKSRVVGQVGALEVLANTISMVRANLNDPQRPIASLLFVGPTGVGKTESAKAAAALMFNSPEQLVRFDLNQYKTAHAASTLVGTLAEPEGLLTSAVRQRPHCVVLLDEVEKAHPDVHDMLLQVLGEGRLTDALGRTTDFTNCLIIMTSNLGTQAGGAGLGFNPTDIRQHFIEAAKKYFRPEFFNRIDEIVPFSKLDQAEVRQIAAREIQRIVQRQGLQRRQCVLKIEPAAIEVAVAHGYHPELGARAMKRALEDGLATSIARQLAELSLEGTTLVHVDVDPDQSDHRKLKTRVQRLERARPTRAFEFDGDLKLAVETAEKFLERMGRSLADLRPRGRISASQLTPELLRYYALDEQFNKIQDTIRELKIRLKENVGARISSISMTARREHSRDRDDRIYQRERSTLSELQDFMQLHQEPIEFETQSLVNECSLLQAMFDSQPTAEMYAVLRPLHLELPKAPGGIRDSQPRLRPYWRYFLHSGYGVQAKRLLKADSSLSADVIKFNGPCIERLLQRLTGIYEFTGSHRKELFQFVPISVDHYDRLAQITTQITSSSQPAVFTPPAVEGQVQMDSNSASPESAQNWGDAEGLMKQVERMLENGQASELGITEDVWNIVHQKTDGMPDYDLKANHLSSSAADLKRHTQILLSGLPLVAEFGAVASRPILPQMTVAKEEIHDRTCEVTGDESANL